MEPRPHYYDHLNDATNESQQQLLRTPYNDNYLDSLGQIKASDTSNWQFGASAALPTSDPSATLQPNRLSSSGQDHVNQYFKQGFGKDYDDHTNLYLTSHNAEAATLDPQLIRAPSPLPVYGQDIHTTSAPPNTIYPYVQLQHQQQDSQQHRITPTLQDPVAQDTTSQRTPQPASLTIGNVDQAALVKAIPKGDLRGSFLIIDPNKLSEATNSKQLNLFVNVGLQEFEFNVTRAAIPIPVVRRSRNQLHALAKTDAALELKLNRRAQKSANKAAAAGFKYKTQAEAARSSTGELYDYSSSEYSSDYDSDEEPLLVFPLPLQRPDNPLKGAEYDAIKAVWRAQPSGISTEEIKKGLVDFWEVVRTIRDRWKADQQAVAHAEEKKRIGELALLKSRVKDQRDMMEVALKAAVTHGNHSILEHFSENNSLLFLFYQFLLDGHKEQDMASDLPRTILKMLAMCTSLTDDKLAKTHLVKLLPRYAKKGDAEIQGLIKIIESASKEGTLRLQADSGPQGKVAGQANSDPAPPPLAKSSTTTTSPTETNNGLKRPAPNSAAGNPAKRPASASNGITSTIKGPTNKLAMTPVVPKRTTPAAIPGKVLTAPAGVTKVRAAVTKPSSFFNAVQSAVKNPTSAATAKPSTASVVATVLKKAEDKSTPRPSPSVATTSSGFSFADAIASLTKSSEKVETAPAVEERQETVQEKAKRLRKEARRSLRVTFKPDSALVDVRYFTQDPAEEGAAKDSSLRKDVSDIGGEGRMFKQHKDMMDLDDDDDPTGQADVKEYYTPDLIDFDDVDKEERERNYAPFGGGALQVESAEKAIREKVEASTLSITYTDANEIPISPKEPPPDDSHSMQQTVAFGIPEGFATERAAKLEAARRSATQQQSPSSAGPLDISKLIAQFATPATQQQPSSLNASPSTSTVPDLNSILGNLHQGQGANGSHTMAPATQHYPQGMQTHDSSVPNLAALFATHQNGVPQQNMHQQQQLQGTLSENPERRRWRENGGAENKEDTTKHKGYFNQGKKFTQQCKYWSSGRCNKGSSCTFLHDGPGPMT